MLASLPPRRRRPPRRPRRRGRRSPIRVLLGARFAVLFVLLVVAFVVIVDFTDGVILWHDARRIAAIGRLCSVTRFSATATPAAAALAARTFFAFRDRSRVGGLSLGNVLVVAFELGLGFESLIIFVVVGILDRSRGCGELRRKVALAASSVWTASPRSIT